MTSKSTQKDYDNIISESLTKRIHLLQFSDPLGCSLFDEIVAGRKTVEGRKNSPKNQQIDVGDTLLLSDRKRGIIQCTVTYVNRYADVLEYLNTEGIEKVFGDADRCRGIKTIDDGVKLYTELIDFEEIRSLKQEYGFGFLGIGIRLVHVYRRYFETLQEPWFSHIRDGRKIVEGRLNKSWVKELQVNDYIEFTRVLSNGEDDSVPQKISLIVTKIKKYPSFTAVFDDAGLEKVLPGVETYEDGIAVYRKFYSEEKEKEFGVVGIYFSLI